MSLFLQREIGAIDIVFEQAVAKASEKLGVDLSSMTPLDRLNYMVKRIETAEKTPVEPTTLMSTPKTTTTTTTSKDA